MRLWGRVTEIVHQRQRGQVIVLFALAFIIITAGLGLGVDMGMWLVERQHLQTATDSAAIAAARYYVAYTGDPSALSIASSEATDYLNAYGYDAGNPLDTGYPIITSPAARQVQVQTRKTRNTLLMNLVGVRTLQASATSVANGEIKADIYVALDLTGSMSATDITNMKTAVNGFVDLLGLDPTDNQGPRVAIGRFLGERCAHNNPGSYNIPASPYRADATVSSNYVSYLNYTATTNGWCDNVDVMPTLTLPTPVPAGVAGVSPPRDGNTSPAPWNAFYPAASTNQTFTQSTSNAHTAVNGIDGGIHTAFCAPSWVALPSMTPYACDDEMSATSHTAGLVTAYKEISANARAAPFRKVLILQTDGTVCTMQTAYTQIAPGASRVPTYVPSGVLPTHGNSSATRSENRAMDVARYMKNTPDAFSGTEIFTIMFWADDGNNSCWDISVFDTGTSLFPACGPDTSSLPPVAQRSHVDDYLIAISSSAPGTCDHYIPATKNNGSSLTNAYRDILKKIAVGKIVS